MSRGRTPPVSAHDGAEHGEGTSLRVEVDFAFVLCGFHGRAFLGFNVFVCTWREPMLPGCGPQSRGATGRA